MSKKRITARKEQARQMVEAEAAARCANCKQPLPKLAGYAWLSSDGLKRFCSPDCLDEAQEAQPR